MARTATNFMTASQQWHRQFVVDKGHSHGYWSSLVWNLFNAIINEIWWLVLD